MPWNPTQEMLYCNKMTEPSEKQIMRHAPRHHPAPAIAPSILRLSVWQRLAYAAGAVIVLWAAVLWAMR